jgi:hypothetical protein
MPEIDKKMLEAVMVRRLKEERSALVPLAEGAQDHADKATRRPPNSASDPALARRSSATSRARHPRQ